jgi:hypothetical protein
LLIQENVWNNHKQYHKEALNELIKKLYVYPTTPPAECRKVALELMETFWDEWTEFNRRNGETYDEDNDCWRSPMIDRNESWKWHYQYSYRSTKVLGKLACRVTSKITGIGSAERNWGDVKHLKSGKRIAMKSENLNMQTTVYGAACVEKAKMKIHADDNKRLFQLWDEKDLETLGLDRFGMNVNENLDEFEDEDDDEDEDSDDSQTGGEKEGTDEDDSIKSESDLVPGPGTGRKAVKRAFICGYFDWEEECARTQSSDSYDRLLERYADIWFYDGDTKYTIHDLMWFKGSNRYSLKCIKEDYNKSKTQVFNEGKFDYFDISDDTVGAIWTSHYDNRGYEGFSPTLEYENFKLVRDDSMIDEDGNWIAWKKKKAEGNKTTKKKKQASPKKGGKKETPKKRKRDT